ncbi:MAG: molybdenum cofactor guanylyltransferase [Bacteroidota bacterium]
MDKGITGIILAGGESRRFDGEKGLAILREKPLIEWVLEAIKPLCSEIIISANTESYQSYGHRIIPDIESGKGPMMGIYSALLNSETEHNLVLSVDTPLVSADLLQYIFQNKGNAQVAVPQSGVNHFEPLIGYYSQNTLFLMEAFFKMNNYKLPDFFKTVSFKGIDLESWDEFQSQFLSNVNTREVLLALEGMR